MTDQEKLSKIEELQNQITPLNYQRIFLETKQHFDKENYYRDYNEDKRKEIIQTDKDLERLNSQLSPLFFALRQLQSKYRVQYDGELTNPDGGTYWQTQIEELYFNTCCVIDTFTYGWQQYSATPSVNSLIAEVYKFLFYHRYTKLSIRNIKSI